MTTGPKEIERRMQELIDRNLGIMSVEAANKMAMSEIKPLVGDMCYNYHTFTLNILRNRYEAICNEYRRRLCDQWELSYEGSFWIADITGEALSVGDYWVLDMTEIKTCVEKGITYEQFDEYWEFTMREAEAGHNPPRINFYSWFELGARPEILKDNEEN